MSRKRRRNHFPFSFIILLLVVNKFRDTPKRRHNKHNVRPLIEMYNANSARENMFPLLHQPVSCPSQFALANLSYSLSPLGRHNLWHYTTILLK
jgi:hypothetical protein